MKIYFFISLLEMRYGLFTKKLKNKKGEVDGIHTNILKKINNCICLLISDIINLCTTECHRHFKIAGVLPILKYGPNLRYLSSTIINIKFSQHI